MNNFFVQAENAQILFRHQCEIELAKQFGAKISHVTPDSCDMVFPNKKAAENFEKARFEDEK